MYLDVQLVWFSPLDFIYICHMYVSMWVCWEEAIKILQVRLCIKFALCKFIYLDSQIISVESVFDRPKMVPRDYIFKIQQTKILSNLWKMGIEKNFKRERNEHIKVTIKSQNFLPCVLMK